MVKLLSFVRIVGGRMTNLRANLVFLVLLKTLSGAPVPHTIGEVSFVAPDGWAYLQKPGEQRAVLSAGTDERYCLLLVYQAVDTSGNVEGDFKSAWTQILGAAEPPPSATSPHRPASGYWGVKGVTMVQHGARLATLYTLETGRKVISIIVLAPDAAEVEARAATIAQFVTGVHLEAQAPATPAPAADPAKTTITLADLVGEWHHSSGNSVDYVYANTGAYASNSTQVYGDAYTISADGSYAYVFNGVANGQVRHAQAKGVVEFVDGLVVFHELPSNDLTRYRLVSYQPGASGATELKLILNSFPPTEVNVRYYGENWVRLAGKK